MDERVLLMSGFYGVRLPDGRRLLEKPPVGQIVEGPNPGPFGLRVGDYPTFRVKNLGDGRYVLQYGADQIPIILYYQSQLEGQALESFEGPFVTDTGISPVGGNQGAYPTLYPPTTAQPVTALPGYVNPPSIQDQTTAAIRAKELQDEINRQRAEAGIVQDFTPPELRNPTDPLAPPRPGTTQAPAPVSQPQVMPSTDVYYMTSAPGGAVVDTTRGGSAPMPSGISPIAVAGAMVLLFLLGDDEGK